MADQPDDTGSGTELDPATARYLIRPMRALGPADGWRYGAAPDAPSGEDVARLLTMEPVRFSHAGREWPDTDAISRKLADGSLVVAAEFREVAGAVRLVSMSLVPAYRAANAALKAWAEELRAAGEAIITTAAPVFHQLGMSIGAGIRRGIAPRQHSRRWMGAAKVRRYLAHLGQIDKR